MIFNKKASLTLASMLVASGMASAQELADSSMINVAFGKVAKTDLMGGSESGERAGKIEERL